MKNIFGQLKGIPALEFDHARKGSGYMNFELNCWAMD